MKLVVRVFKYIIYSLLIFNLIVAIGSRITQKPFLLSAVRSNSMSPVIRKGDMLLLNNFYRNENIRKNDIIVFKTKSGNYKSKGWIVHRIIGGNNYLGYITKGDSNQNIDQIDNENPSIDIRWIACKIITINDTPLKVPYIGYLYLWMERLHDTILELILPIIIIFLFIIIIYIEMSSKYKRQRKKKYTIYILSGLTLLIIIAIKEYFS